MDTSGPSLALRREQRMKEQSRVLRIINISYLIAVALLGLLIISVSAWMIGTQLWLCPILNLVYVMPWVTLSIGFGNVVIAIIGGVLLYKGKTRGTFQPFMIGTALLVIGLMIVFILSIKVGTDLERAEYATSVMDLFVEAKNEFRSNDFGRDALTCWHRLQKNFQCCGGFTPNDWLSSTNASVATAVRSGVALERYMDAPQSCICPRHVGRPNSPRLNSTCVHMRDSSGSVMLFFRVGCIPTVLPVVKEHLTVLKVVAPCVSIFISFHVGVALFATIRSRRLSAVDVYAMAIVGAGAQGQEGAGEGGDGCRDSHRLRRGRFAPTSHVSGVAPFALELETTQGCT